MKYTNLGGGGVAGGRGVVHFGGGGGGSCWLHDSEHGHSPHFTLKSGTCGTAASSVFWVEAAMAKSGKITKNMTKNVFFPRWMYI